MFKMSFVFLFLFQAHNFLLAEEIKEPLAVEVSSSQEKKQRIKDTKHFFSFGLSTGFSGNGPLIGKNQNTGENLEQLRFRSGLGAPLGLFVDFRVFNNFSVRAEFISYLMTGGHVRSVNRFAYPLLLSLGGYAGLYYQFEFDGGGITWRPFVGFGLGVSSSSFSVNNKRKTDNATFPLYDLHLGIASFSWYGTFGYKFLLGKKAFIDLSLRFSRQAYAESVLDLSKLSDIGGNFETDESTTIEISRNSYLKTNAFMIYDFLLTLGWWL
jgi:hypothetical protein